MKNEYKIAKDKKNKLKQNAVRDEWWFSEDKITIN